MKHRCLRGQHGVWLPGEDGKLVAVVVKPGDVIDIDPEALHNKTDAFGPQFEAYASTAPQLGIDLEKSTVKQISAFVSATDDLDLLVGLLKAEGENRNRKGVKSSIARRVESFEEPEEAYDNGE